MIAGLLKHWRYKALIYLFLFVYELCQRKKKQKQKKNVFLIASRIPWTFSQSEKVWPHSILRNDPMIAVITAKNLQKTFQLIYQSTLVHLCSEGIHQKEEISLCVYII